MRSQESKQDSWMAMMQEQPMSSANFATTEEKETPPAKAGKEKQMKITEESKSLFAAFAKDADNWGGTPLVGGNVRGSKELRGNLTQLKRAGLVTTFEYDGEKWVQFTDSGKAFAAELGISL